MTKNSKTKSSVKIKSEKKVKLPFSPKDFSKGSKKIHDGLKKLKNEWSDSETSSTRKKEIFSTYISLYKEWTKIKKFLKKHKL